MDRLFLNGEILTLNAYDELAEAMLTVGGEIVFVGDGADALSLADLDTEIIDLGGRALISRSAYRLLGTAGGLAEDFRRVPALLQELGGDCLEWGSAAPFVILNGRIIGCPPEHLGSLRAILPEAVSGEPFARLLLRSHAPSAAYACV